jgi:nascent polypeptide-associated complex subunit alpha
MGMKMDPKHMEKMMKQMGMNVTNIDAEEVIIRTADKDIIILEPQVSKIKVMGQETFQISGGEVSEREREDINDDDVEMVSDEAGVSKEEARAMLKETGDIAEAIMKLKKE